MVFEPIDPIDVVYPLAMAAHYADRCDRENTVRHLQDYVAVLRQMLEQLDRVEAWLIEKNQGVEIRRTGPGCWHTTTFPL